VLLYKCNALLLHRCIVYHHIHKKDRPSFQAGVVFYLIRDKGGYKLYLPFRTNPNTRLISFGALWKTTPPRRRDPRK